MRKVLAVMVGSALAVVSAWAQQPSTKPASQAPPAEQMPMPGPEHKVLAGMAGTWDATVEMTAPDGKADVTKGVETTRMVGGLWAASDFKGTMMQQPFEGHGVWGYDTAKKKYVGTWVDSMSTSIMRSEGTYAAATKTMTEWMEGPGMDGQPHKWKLVTEWKDPDTRVFSMYDDGKPTPSMRITYKRRK